MKAYCKTCQSAVTVASSKVSAKGTVTAEQAFACETCGTLIREAKRYISAPVQSTDRATISNAVVFTQFAGMESMKDFFDAHQSEVDVEEMIGTFNRTPVGRYQEREHIDAGGMGVIRVAFDQDLNREVAMKVIKNAKRASPEKVRRFIREAQVTGQLEHAAIVPVHEFAVDVNGHLFYTMKLVRGQTLATVIANLKSSEPATLEAYPLTRLLDVFTRVCEAIAYAHSRGVLHRDIKPANIMVGQFGETQVLDWGLAKLLTEVPQPAAGTFENSPRTMLGLPQQTQRGLGTPYNMSPEQVAGLAHDQRSDIYSLGTLLYELLSLQHSVQASNATQVMRKVAAGDTIPLESHQQRRPLPHIPNGKIPKGLVAVVEKAMAFNVDDRYPNVPTLIEDLRKYQEGYSPTAERAGRLKRTGLWVKRHKAIALMTLLVCATAAVLGGTSIANLIAYKNEAETRRTQAQGSAPAFYKAALKLLPEQDFSAALTSVEQAIEYDPSLSDAHLLRAYLLAEQEDFAGALASAQQAGFNEPVIPILREIQAGKDGAMGRLGLQASGDAYPVFSALFDARSMQKGAPSAEQLNAWRAKLNEAQPHLGRRLAFNPSYGLSLNLKYHNLANLKPLKDLPLNALDTEGMQGGDKPDNSLNLEPLRGMPLRYFKSKAAITDLSPIASPELKIVDCASNPMANQCNWQVLEGLDLESFTVPDRYAPKNLRVKNLIIRSHFIGEGEDGFNWLENIEGLQRVRFERTGVTRYNNYNLRALSRIPTLRMVSMQPQANISRSSVLLRPEFPATDIAMLEGWIGAIQNDTEVTRWWRHHWELSRYLLKKRIGEPAERPDNPWIVDVGDETFAIVNTALQHGPKILDYLGVQPARIDNADDQAAALKLIGAVDLPGLTPSLKIHLLRYQDKWIWRDGTPLDPKFAPIRPGAGDGRKLFVAGDAWTFDGSGSACHLLSWPKEGPPVRNVEDLVHEYYPIYQPKEFGGRRYAVIGTKIKRDAAEAIAKTYGATLARFESKDEARFLYEEIKQQTGRAQTTCWITGKSPTADGDTAWAMERATEVLKPRDTPLAFVLEWSDPNSVPKQRPGAGVLNPVRPHFFNGYEYRNMRQRVTWNKAQYEAERLGGSLCCIHSDEEFDFVLNTFGESKELWLGGQYDHREANWRWIDGKLFRLKEDVWCADFGSEFGEEHKSVAKVFLSPRDGFALSLPEQLKYFLVKVPIDKKPK